LDFPIHHEKNTLPRAGRNCIGHTADIDMYSQLVKRSLAAVAILELLFIVATNHLLL